MEKSLNPKQKEAVEFGRGPLLIIAGAGTGKTTVITERIRYLIIEKETPPENVLALTFTDKASFEMQERIDVLMPYGYTNMWIHTFHAFCDRILRDDAHSIGLDPNYALISESEAILLMRQNIFNLGLKTYRPLGNPTKFLDALLTHFARLKDEDISPEQYLTWAESEVESDESAQYKELATAYKSYEELKVKNSYMDFSDLISNTLKLFRERPHILKKYQKQFKFILVDEFQDTNYAQNELAIMLAGDDHNITVVADDDQSIYRFRGAAVSNVLQFKKNFPDAHIVTLTDNYRSTQTILDASYSLIQGNNPNRLEIVEGIDKKLKSHSKASKKPIELIHETRAEDEADAIARKILELSKTYSFKDVAILVRANNHAQLVTTALQRHKIPYQFLGPGYLFQQDEVKDLIAYIMFLNNLSDTVSLFRVISMDIFSIPSVELNFLLNFSKKKNLTLFESLYFLEQPFLKPETQQKLTKFKEMVERHIELSKKEKAGQILYYFLIDSGIFETLAKTDTTKEERRVQNIAKFFDRIKNFESEKENSNIFTVSDWLSLVLSMGDSPTAADIDMRDQDAVSILTVHSSKGLEFDVVFLINLVNDRFPSRARNEKIPLPTGVLREDLQEDIDFHLQEERRLFYVGITRARERLFFTAADYYGTGKRIKKLSPFIFEALPDLKTKKEQSAKIQQLSLTEVLSVYTEKEEYVEPKTPHKVGYITYSNLQMFDICPLHYKAKVIFNIPTPTASVQSFGIAMHNTLQKFYENIKAGDMPNVLSLQELLKKEWISDGFDSKAYESERKIQGERMLNEFYKTNFPNDIPLTTPLGLEMPFNFTLKNGVKVFGKIDRIDATSTGIEIIDYKTGEDNPKASKAHELQLAMYALAAIRVKDPVLNRRPDEITLSLYFLEGNSKKSMTFTQEDLEKFEDELVSKIEEIEKSDFKCSKNVLCVNCEYKLLCNTI
ncbi:MAG: ATP-dependent helicase [Candidatus Levybacteria bacterium]|nr:ATP-dependent helicase [Candidatus Levybacteria bacterium]